MPVSPDYEWPNCWHRHPVDPERAKTDPVDACVEACPWRKGQIRMFLGETRMDYDCTNPAIQDKQTVEGAKFFPDGKIIAGGLASDYGTFCEAVDLYLTSTGYPSQLIMDAVAYDIPPQLPATTDPPGEAPDRE